MLILGNYAERLIMGVHSTILFFYLFDRFDIFQDKMLDKQKKWELIFPTLLYLGNPFNPNCLAPSFLRMDQIIFGLDHMTHTIHTNNTAKGGKSQKPQFPYQAQACRGYMTSAHLSEPQFPER